MSLDWYYVDYIPQVVVFVLRWQLSPTQMKCTCNANESTFILHDSLIEMRYNMVPVWWLCKNFFFFNYIFISVKIFEMFPTQNLLRYSPQRDHYNARWNIGFWLLYMAGSLIHSLLRISSLGQRTYYATHWTSHYYKSVVVPTSIIQRTSSFDALQQYDPHPCIWFHCTI